MLLGLPRAAEMLFAQTMLDPIHVPVDQDIPGTAKLAMVKKQIGIGVFWHLQCGFDTDQLERNINHHYNMARMLLSRYEQNNVSIFFNWLQSFSPVKLQCSFPSL